MALTPADITQITNLIAAQLAANRIKISQLPVAGTLTRDAIFPVVDNGSTQSVTMAVLQEMGFVVVPVGQDLRAMDPDALIDGQMFYITGVDTPNDGGEGPWIYDANSLAVDNIGTVIAPDSGIGRFLRQWDGPLNVKWFEAKGDGVTNDTNAIALTIAAAAMGSGYPTSVQRARAVYLPVGNYLVDSIELPFSGMVFQGDSRGGTFITYTGASEKGIYTPPGDGTNAAINLTLRDFTQNLTNMLDTADYRGIQIENSYGNNLTDIYTLNSGTTRYALAIYHDCYTTKVTNCSFLNILVEGHDGNLRTIQHTFDNVDAYHFVIKYAGNITIENSAIQGNYPEKFLLDTVNGLTVQNCDIENGPGGTSEIIFRGNCGQLNAIGNLLNGSNLTLVSAYGNTLVPGAICDPDVIGFLNPNPNTGTDQYAYRKNNGVVYDPSVNGRYSFIFGNGTSPDTPLVYDRLLNMYFGRRRGTNDSTPFIEREAGEVIERSEGTSGSPIALTTNVAMQLATDIELDGGIWEAQGYVYVENQGGGTTVTALAIGIQDTVATPQADRNAAWYGFDPTSETAKASISIIPFKIPVDAGDTATIKLVVYALFSGGSGLKCWGGFQATRQG